MMVRPLFLILKQRRAGQDLLRVNIESTIDQEDNFMRTVHLYIFSWKEIFLMSALFVFLIDSGQYIFNLGDSFNIYKRDVFFLYLIYVSTVTSLMSFAHVRLICNGYILNKRMSGYKLERLRQTSFAGIIMGCAILALSPFLYLFFEHIYLVRALWSTLFYAFVFINSVFACVFVSIFNLGYSIE